MDLVYFIFIFHFYLFIFLYFLLLTKGKEDKNIILSQSHKSYAHMIQWNNIEGSKEDDVIWHS